MKKWWKLAAAMMLAAVLFFSGPVFASAEGDEDEDFDYMGAYGVDYEALQADAAIAHWGAVMVEEMQVKAFELAKDEEDYYRKFELTDLANVYTLDPIRFLSVDITEEQAFILQETFGVETMGEVALKLGDMLNSDYETYAEPAQAVFSFRELYEDYLGEEFDNGPIGPFVAFFTYNRMFNGYDNSHIVVITGDDSSIGANFVISSKESALTMDESFIVEYATLLGIPDFETRLYYGDDLKWLMGMGESEDMPDDIYTYWPSRYCALTNAFKSVAQDSPDYIRLLFEQWKEGIGSDDLCGEVAGAYMSGEGPEEALFVSQELLDPVRYGKNGSSILYEYLTYNSPVVLRFLEEEEIPEIIGSDAWNETGEELTEFPEDAKVLILFHRYAEDEFDQTGIDWLLQAVLPSDNLAQSIEEADYIVYCDVTYDGEKYTQGDLELIYPYNHISIHDAETGEIVKTYDPLVRRLNGFTTVTSNITYWYPLREPVWNAIKGLFPIPERFLEEEEEIIEEDIFDWEDPDEEETEEEVPEEDFEETTEEPEEVPETPEEEPAGETEENSGKRRGGRIFP